MRRSGCCLWKLLCKCQSTPNAQSILMCVNFPKKIEMKHFFIFISIIIIISLSVQFAPVGLKATGYLCSCLTEEILLACLWEYWNTLSKNMSHYPTAKQQPVSLHAGLCGSEQSITCDRPKGLICDQTFRPNSARWFSTGEKCLCGPYFEQSVTVWLKEEKKAFLELSTYFFLHNILLHSN